MKKFFQKRKRNLLTAKSILDVFDKAAEAFAFPMLDNGYVYLAASRLSLFRSDENWAVVFEIFGYSPRVGHPDLSIVTISSELHDRNKPADYVSTEAYENYLMNNPYWEMRNFWPISNEEWMDREKLEFVAVNGEIVMRGQKVNIPRPNTYSSKGVDVDEAQPSVFELCRFLAHDHRQELLATESERRVSVLPSMKQIMLIDEWHHPDLVNGQPPSQTETFRQLARVLETNDTALYSPAEQPNNHWKNWPKGGTL